VYLASNPSITNGNRFKTHSKEIESRIPSNALIESRPGLSISRFVGSFCRGDFLHAIQTSANDFDYGSGRYDLIYATFEHQIITDNAAKIVPALKPGGMVVIEGFQEDESKEVGFRLGHGVNEVLRAFDRLRIVFYEDTIGPADWNDGKRAPIVRFIARKEK
jgi:hypothetical protein